MMFFWFWQTWCLFKSGDFDESGESAYPGNSVHFDEDFDYSVESGVSGYYGNYCDLGESGNSSAKVLVNVEFLVVSFRKPVATT